MPAGGDAGGLVGKGQNAFQLFHRQGVQLLLAELGQGSPKEGIACAVGITTLQGTPCHMAGLVPKAVEYAVCTKVTKISRMPFCASCAVPLSQSVVPVCRGSSSSDTLEYHRGRGAFIWAMHLFVLQRFCTVVGVISNDSTSFWRGQRIQRGSAGGVSGQGDSAKWTILAASSLVRNVSLTASSALGLVVKLKSARGGIHRDTPWWWGGLHPPPCRNVYLVFLPEPLSGSGKGIRTHLAIKAVCAPSLESSHRRLAVHRRGLRQTWGDAARILAGLGQVDQTSPIVKNVHGVSSLFLSYKPKPNGHRWKR